MVVFIRGLVVGIERDKFGMEVGERDNRIYWLIRWVWGILGGR